MADIAKLEVVIGAKIQEFERKLDKVEAQMKGTKKSADKLSSGMASLGAAVAGAFAVERVIQFGFEVIKTTAEFQKFEAVLTNTLGSNSEAQKALSQITEFAAKTPFSVIELSDAFVKLTNQGLKPSQEEMRKYGDVASSTGKTFDQLAEAVIDATTGQFERLKEFGIKASKNGDIVAFTFKGVTTEVDYTNDAIKDYIISLGDIEGVSGSMAAISKTLGGQISNLGDSFDQLKLAIGEATKEGTESFISSLNDVISKSRLIVIALDDINKQLDRSDGKEVVVIDDNILTNAFNLLGSLTDKLADYGEEVEKANSATSDITTPGKGFDSLLSNLSAQLNFYELAASTIDTVYLVALERAEKQARATAKAASDMNVQLGIAADLAVDQIDFLKDGQDISFIGGSAGKLGQGAVADDEAIDLFGLPKEEELAEYVQIVDDFANEVGNLIGDFTSGSLATLAEGFGLLFTGKIGLDEFFRGILDQFASFVVKFGELMIKYGTAGLALKSFNPFAQIAAGIALVAIGTALGSLADNGPNLSGGGGASVGRSIGTGGSPNFSNPFDNLTDAQILSIKGFDLEQVRDLNRNLLGRTSPASGIKIGG